jgi:hypothetical protein
MLRQKNEIEAMRAYDALQFNPLQSSGNYMTQLF